MAQWPTSLPRTDGITPDVTGISELLATKSARLFSSRAFRVDACIIQGDDTKPEVLYDNHALSNFLQQLPNPNVQQAAGSSSAEIFIISQIDSRSTMKISQTATTTLFGHFNVLPSFMNILANFGYESGPYTSGCSRFYSISHENDVFETAYSLKHVEKNNRDTQWSIRQTGIYQKYHNKNSHCSNILLQPSERINRRIGTLIREKSMSKLSKHWTSLHQEYLISITHEWDNYIKYLDQKVTEITLPTNFVKFPSVDEESRVSFRDLQALHRHIEALIRITNALALNIEVIKHLSEQAKARAASPESDGFSRQCYRDFEQTARTCLADHIFLQHHASLVMQIAERLSVQLRDTISLQDSNIIETLTRKTITEAQTMKVLTFIALVYLPVSFVAAFLQLEYITVEKTSSSVSIHFDPKLLVFLVLAVPMLLLTLGVWWGWEKVIRRREQKLHAEQQKKLEEEARTPAREADLWIRMRTFRKRMKDGLSV